MAKQDSDPRTATLVRIRRTEAYAEKVRLLFAKTVNDILALNKTMPSLDEGVMFSFDGESVKKQKEVEVLLRRLHSTVTMAIQQGVKLEWDAANQECDNLVQSVFGKKVLESPEFSAWMGRNTAARDAFLSRSEHGMNLSDRVWKSVRQLRDEMEVAMTVSIGEGESSSSMSRKVRQYLNNPDDMFRRFRYKKGEKDIIDPETGEITGKEIVYGKKWKKRIKDEVTGKYKWIDYDRDSYKTGAGVYKSSARNAMRVARTETNIAYRRADNARWQNMDFVLGQRVQLSKNHPKKDICDKLQGDYPKDFVFDGWHPQCFCFATPILVDVDTMAKMTEDFLAGKDWRAEHAKRMKGKQITDYPAAFKDWVREHSEDIAAARERGTEPYFIRNNAQAVDEIINPKPKELSILEKAKLRHDARTPEQEEAIKNAWEERKHKHQLIKKTAGNVLNVAQDYGEVDFSELQAAIKSGDLTKMQELAKTVAQHVSAMKKQEAAISDLIPDAHNWHKQFTMKELINAYTAIETKLADLSGKSLAEQKKILEKEIKYVEDPTFLKPHTQYPTWKVVQDAYAEKLKDVIYQQKVESIKAQMSVVESWSANHPKSLKVANLLAAYKSSLVAKEDVNIIQQKATLAYSEYQKRLAEQARRDAKKIRKNAGEALIKFDDNTRTQARKDAAEWHLNDDSANDFFYAETNTREQWKAASAAEKQALYQYTSGSSYITEPLRAIKGYYHYYTSRKDECERDVDAMTSIISRTYCTKDVWIKRDEGAWCTEYRWGIPDLSAYESNPSALVGKIGVDESFMSCGSNKNTYFGDKKVILNIYCPAQTRMIYAEPFSAFGYSHDNGDHKPGKNWNGDSKPTSMGENEIILQRGTKMRITKAEYTRGKWYIDCEVLSQYTRPIDEYVVDSGGFYCKFK